MTLTQTLMAKGHLFPKPMRERSTDFGTINPKPVATSSTCSSHRRQSTNKSQGPAKMPLRTNFQVSIRATAMSVRTHFQCPSKSLLKPSVFSSVPRSQVKGLLRHCRVRRVRFGLNCIGTNSRTLGLDWRTTLLPYYQHQSSTYGRFAYQDESDDDPDLELASSQSQMVCFCICSFEFSAEILMPVSLTTHMVLV